MIDNPLLKFENMCQGAESGEDLLKVAAYYSKLFESDIFPKKIYNLYIGWGLPERETCQLVVNTWKRFPHKRLVDFGAGTGVFCKVFNHLGIDKDKLIAVDRLRPSHTSEYSKNFWPIHRDNNYVVDIDDILFISWGTAIGKVIDSYISRGGTTIILLGESDNGCTFPSDYLKDRKDWEVKLHHVPGPASQYAEMLSVNIKINS